MYTMLFVACGNCRDKGEGLSRVTRLREELHARGAELNERNYHALIRGEKREDGGGVIYDELSISK